MAYLEVGVKEGLYIDLLEDYRDSCDQVDGLQKETYGLVHAGLLWSKTISAELATIGFEQYQANPYVFRRVYCAENCRHHRGIRQRPAGGERNEE